MARDAPKSAIPAMCAHVAFGVCYFLTAQRVLDMRLVSPEAQPLTGMIYASDAASASAGVLMARLRAGRDGRVTATARRAGKFPRAALLLPVFDLFGLTCAFEAMRALGGPLYQTISGLLIPLSALLSKVVLKRTFTKGQIGAIAVVICGLAVKAKDVADEAARRGTAIDARGILIANAATVSYGFRGLVMEYLSASKSSLSGNAQTMLMGTCGLAAFAIYTLARTARDMDGMVWAYYNASPRDVSSILKVHLGNMLSRAFMVKMMMAVVARAGATQLALSNAIRSVGVIAFSHVLFCSNDARQCLSYNGAISAVMVVTGGLAYAMSGKPKTAAAAAPKTARARKTTVAVARADAKPTASPSSSVRRRSARRGS